MAVKQDDSQFVLMKLRASKLLMTFLTIGFACFDAIAAQPKPEPHLPSLLDPSTTRRQWEQKRQQMVSEWHEVLGPFPKHKAPLQVKVLGTEKLDDFTRKHIKYQVEPGVFVEGYLLTPVYAKGKLPGLVVFHGTSGYGARGAAGVEPKYEEPKRQGLQFVKAGYIVWCPNNYINTPGADYAGNAKKVLAQHPDWTGMTRMAWDAIRAADFMESLPNVDKKRIACFGHSLGGKEVLYAMAFDDRYCAGVSSEGGIGLNFSNWDAIWYLGSKIQQAGFPREHHELLALAAPRPFLVIAGDFADDSRSERFIDAVRPVYALYHAENNLEFANHHKGHPYGPHAQTIAEKFLAWHLKEPGR